MAKIPISSVKAQFETGDRPTGADYVNLIDTTAAQATDLGTSGNNELTIFGIENTTTIDTFVAAEWRLVKYIISVSKTTGGDNKFYATELSILVDGSDLNITEYGIIDNDGDMGTISVSRAGANVNVVYAPNPAIKPVTVRFGRIGLKA